MVSRKSRNTSSTRHKSPPVKLQLHRQFEETVDGNPEGEELSKDQNVRLKDGQTNEQGEESEEDKEDGDVDEGNEDNEEASEDDEDEGDPDDEATDPGGKGVNKDDKTEGGGEGEDQDRATQAVTKQLRERQPATRVKPSASKLHKVKATAVVKRRNAKIVAETIPEPAVLKPRDSTTANIVFAAIASSTDKGVSLMGIKKHFMNHYPEKDWTKSRVRVKTAISRALEDGSIMRTKPNGKAQGAQGMFKVKKVKTLPELPNVKVVKKNPSTSKASSKAAVKKTSKAKSPNNKENVKLSRKKPSKKNEESEVVEASGKNKMPAKLAHVGRNIPLSPL